MVKHVLLYLCLTFYCIPGLAGPGESQGEREILNPDADTLKLCLPVIEEGHFLSPVYLFLERYFNNLLSLGSKKEQLQRLHADMVDLRINDLAFENSNSTLPWILQAITPDLPLLIQDNEKKIRVCWLVNNEADRIELIFSKRYDLILGQDKKELTDSFREELNKFHFIYEEEASDFDFEPSRVINNVYADLGETYLIPEMESGQYIQMKGGKFEYLLSERMGEESLLNLFSHADRMNRKNKLNLQIHAYDNVYRQEYTLDRLCAFMKARHCKTFLGIESADEEYTGTVLYVNRLLGYMHLLHFRFPRTAFFREDDEVSIKIYPYIPISNIENLYDKGI